jgi:hypothetical protein
MYDSSTKWREAEGQLVEQLSVYLQMYKWERIASVVLETDKQSTNPTSDAQMAGATTYKMEKGRYEYTSSSYNASV